MAPLLSTLQITGEPLVQRPDDNEGTVAKRLESYHRQTRPVLEYYGKQNLVSTVNADQPMPVVWTALRQALDGKNHQ